MTKPDPGLQRERTAMAWSRTGLAVLVNSLIVLRAGVTANHVPVITLGTFLLAAAGAAVGCGTYRARRLATGGNATTPWILMAGTVAVVWTAAVATIASVMVTL